MFLRREHRPVTEILVVDDDVTSLAIINVRGSLIPVIDLNEAARQGGRE